MGFTKVVAKLPADATHDECWKAFIRGINDVQAIANCATAISYPSLRQAWVSKGDVSWHMIVLGVGAEKIPLLIDQFKYNTNNHDHRTYYTP